MNDAVPRLNEALEGRYSVEGELGEGAMARVYLARDSRHGRQVAVKVLKPELGVVVGSDRFLAEIRTTAKLQHPHILPLYDSGEADGLLFYVMPYVEGETLRERLDREGQLPVDEAVRIARGAASGLQYAHEHGVIHRDVKPENILLQAGEPLVADFGIALAISEAGSVRLTEAGISLGTPSYMSPEQAAGDSEPGPRSDVYSLGCVLYELLTGEPPHTGATVHATLAKLLTELPVRPRTLRPAISERLDAAIMKSLQKVPADRFPTASAFARELTGDPGLVAAEEPRRHELVQKAWTLTADLCRRLDRADLDPRMIGDHLEYWDNKVASDVLVIHLHGFGADHRSFRDALETSPYRGIAATLYGFEPEAARSVGLSIEGHLTLLEGFIADVRAAVGPEVMVLVGFSSGADLLFRAIAGAPEAWTAGVDAFLALGANVSLDTCFVTSIFARLEAGEGSEILPDLIATGADAETLGEWLNTHEYLVTVLRKFQSDFTPLRRHGREIVRPFERGDPVFPGWFRAASDRIGSVRCVFADTEIEREAFRAVMLDHLDSGSLGDSYREGAIAIEDGADHFDLLSSSCINRHVRELAEGIRSG